MRITTRTQLLKVTFAILALCAPYILGAEQIAVDPECVTAPSGLVNWWPGEGNANDGADGSNGSLFGGLGFAAGEAGQAFTFDGVDDYVSFGNTAGNFGTNSFTIEFWMQTTSTDFVNSVLEKWSICGHANFFNIRMSGPGVGTGYLSTELESDAAGNNHVALISSKRVNDGVYHHVALVRSPTTLSYFIDGALDVAVTTPGIANINNTADLVAGKSVCVGVDGTTYFRGQLDEISLYHRALSASEIQAVYNAGSAGKCPPPPSTSCVSAPTGLVNWWPGEGNANDAVDGANGTPQNGAMFAPGKVGQAFTFDGVDDYVSFGNTAGNFGTNDFTIDFWIKTTSTRHESIIEKWPVCGFSSMFTIRLEAGGLGVAMSSDSAGNNYGSFVSRQINDGVFHHAALVRQGTNLTIYIDGALDVTSSTVGVTRISNAVNLVAGQSVCVGVDGTQPFTGQLDEISIYSRALTAGEIQSINNAGSAGKCPPPACVTPPLGLVSWWQAENNALDSADGNNGSLQNGAAFAAGRVGQGFAFDGVNDLVRIPKAANLDVGNQVTIEFWMRADPSNLMNSYQGLVTSDFYGIEISNGYSSPRLGVNFFLSTDSGASETPASYPDTADANGGGAVVSAGQWHHVAGTYDGTKLQLYIDGQPWGNPAFHSGPISPMLANSFVTIGSEDGRTICPGCFGARYFNGLIDEVSIYNRALSVSEIQSIYNANGAGKCSSNVPPPIGPFTNGSFESPIVAPGGHALPSGSTNITRWRLGGPGTVSFINGPAGGVVNPTHGAQHLDFNSGDSVAGATLSQTFTTSIGQTYVVSFNAGRFGPGGPTMRFMAEVKSAMGAVLSSLTAVAPNTQDYGPLQTFIFTATTANSTLTFTDTSSATVGVDVLLDNVSVTPSIGACVTPPDGLVHWWPGDDHAADIVDGANGTLQNGSTFTAGKVGQAFSFDGVNDYVSFGNAAGNFGTSDFTIEYWIKTSSTRIESVLGKWGNCGLSSFFAMRLQPGKISIEMASDGSGNNFNSRASNRSINDGIYHHVAAVRQGNTVTLYIDGLLDYTNSTAGITVLNNSANLLTGSGPCIGVDGTQPFTGQLDEIAMYNRALTLAEIQSIYNANSAGKCTPIAPPPPVGPFTNGSFESPIVAPGGHALPSGSTNITRWILGGPGTVSFINGPAGGVVNPVEGAQHLDFDSGDSVAGATLSQTFTTVIGQPYTVGFYVGRFGPGGPTMSLFAEAKSSTGAVLGSLIGVAPNTQTYGPLQTFTFTATTTNSTLIFTDTSSATVGVDVLLDNVSVTPSGGACVAPPNGLANWWQAEGDANASTGGANGTLQNGATFAAGKVGQAFTFDGVNDYVSFGNTAGNFGTSDFTIEYWIKTTSTRIEPVLGKWGNCGLSSFFAMRLNPGKITIEMASDGSGNNFNSRASNRSINDGIYHHIAAVRQGNTVSLYIDGVLDYTNSTPGVTVLNNSADLLAGSGPCIGIDGTQPFTGHLDEIAMYNRALSVAEIQSIYNAASAGKCGLPPTILTYPQNRTVVAGENATFTVSATGSPQLRYQWRFGAANMPIPGATNSSLTVSNAQLGDVGDYNVVVSNDYGTAPSSNAHLTVNAEPVCATAPAGLANWWRAEGNANDTANGANGTLQNGATFVAGKVNQAFTFDGVDDYVSFGNTAGNFGTSDFTIEYWIKTTSTRIEPVLGKWGNCGFSSFFAMRLQPAKISVEMASDGSGNNFNSRASNRSINDGIYHHIAVVRQANTVTLYIDGVLDYSNSTPGITVLNNSANLLAGSGPCIGVDGTQPFTGQLDDVAMYNRALTPAEILSIYDAGSAGKCAPPPGNHAPTASPQSVSVNEDTSAPITLTGSDVDGDTFTFTVVDAPTHGTLAGTVPNLTYTPNANYFGPDSFTFKVNDGQVDSALATVSINVHSTNDAPVVKATVSPLAQFPGLTNLVVIAPNNTNAEVVLDGSLSSDAENAPLQYSWSEGTNVIATGVLATNVLDVGTHVITLTVSDGTDVGMATVEVEVITPAQSIGILISMVEQSSLPRKSQRPLNATLKVSAASFDEGNMQAGIHQLEAFQNKVRAQVTPFDQALADRLTDAAQEIIDALRKAEG